MDDLGKGRTSTKLVYMCVCVCVYSQNLWSNLENLKNNTKLDSLLNEFFFFWRKIYDSEF